jgi:predicted amidohydrolase YtcJ
MTTVFRADRVYASSREVVEAFAVSGEHVVATGGFAALRAQFPDAEVVDFGRATIVPGFNDAHMHLAMAAEDVLHLDLSVGHVRSLAVLLDHVRAEAASIPAGGWIRGSRYDDAKMSERRVLTRADLDAAAPDHPVLVVHVAAHWGVVNSLALALAGIDETMPEPPGGRFGRDAAGRLNGLMFEQALFDFANPAVARGGRTYAPESSFDDRLRGLERAQQMFHAAGITSIGDAMMGPSELALFSEARSRGTLTMRVNALVTIDHYDALRRLGLRTGFGDVHLRIGGVKAFVDGAIGGRTCLLDHPFEGRPDDYGMQTTPTAELHEIVRRVHADGNRLCVHANGDRAIALLLDGFERAYNEQPLPTRHRIEHCSLVNESILPRMHALGAIAAPFAGYAGYHGGSLIDWYGPERVNRMFAHRWFLDAGVLVAGSSDYPCGPYEPLYGMQSCITRTGEDGVTVGAVQRITPAEALDLYTLNAAEAAGESGVKGRLAPAYLADFVVLEEDPLHADPARLTAIGIEATYVGGVAVWTRA